MNKNKILKALNIFFTAVGFIAICGLILVMVTNVAGLGTLISVLGLMKTQSLYSAGTTQLINGATAGVVEALDDPYSKYLDQQTWQDLKQRMDAKFGGIGIYVLEDDAARLKVVSPIEGTPAFKAGLKNGDIITKINDDSTINMNQDDAVHLMRGDPGTQLQIEIYRESDKKTYDFKITREIINVPSVFAQLVKYHPQFGYIRLNQFTSQSAQEMTDNVNNLVKKDKIKGLILDLRENGGGDFDAALNIASIFLNDQEIVTVADAHGNKSVHRAPRGGIDTPLVVLVNGDSASASEILAGALKDNGRAVLVGDKTYGKGLVQTVFPLLDGGALKLTTQKYYTPKGTDINKIGIQPDYTVKMDANATQDTQLQRAIELLINEK